MQRMTDGPGLTEWGRFCFTVAVSRPHETRQARAELARRIAEGLARRETAASRAALAEVVARYA